MDRRRSRLARHVLEADKIAVPDHFHLECASALRRMEFRGEVSAAEVQETREQFLALRVRRIDTAPLFSEAWTIRRNVTVADALYVVIARHLEVALVTGDARLARAPGLGIAIIGSSSPPPR